MIKFEAGHPAWPLGHKKASWVPLRTKNHQKGCSERVHSEIGEMTAQGGEQPPIR